MSTLFAMQKQVRAASTTHAKEALQDGDLDEGFKGCAVQYCEGC